MVSLPAVTKKCPSSGKATEPSFSVPASFLPVQAGKSKRNNNIPARNGPEMLCAIKCSILLNKLVGDGRPAIAASVSKPLCFRNSKRYVLKIIKPGNLIAVAYGYQSLVVVTWSFVCARDQIIKGTKLNRLAYKNCPTDLHRKVMMLIFHAKTLETHRTGKGFRDFRRHSRLALPPHGRNKLSPNFSIIKLRSFWPLHSS